ncbi:MAG TPA: CsgG/HfaB family protein [Panacibacter sp.]|nr:CsgG/HfaB family protein [Panacibacter sp.]
MKQNNKKVKAFLFLAIQAFISSIALAQQDIKADKNKDKVTIENIKQQCSNLAMEKRPRITVARFNLTAPNAPKDQFGDNLATMLTNSLQEVQCYRVLERLSNSNDLTDEINFQQSDNADKSKAAQKGKMLGANVIVQGEITEFQQSEKSMGLTVLKKTTYTSKVGIIIKMVNPETREVLVSKSLNVEKKVGGGVKVGVTLPIVGDINAASSAFKNPAVQDAVEDCIIQAVEFISSQRDKVPMPVNEIPDNASKVTVKVKNIEYGQLSELASALEKIPGVISVNSDDFTDNTANIIIIQSIKLKDLIDKIMLANTGLKLSVEGVSKDMATFIIKK